MQWISQNWVWVLFFGAFIAMHLFGHGGHGGGRGGHGGNRDTDDNFDSAGDRDPQGSSRQTGHHH